MNIAESWRGEEIMNTYLVVLKVGGEEFEIEKLDDTPEGAIERAKRDLVHTCPWAGEFKIRIVDVRRVGI